MTPHRSEVGHVSRTVRRIAAAYGALAVWMACWVAHEAERLDKVLPAPWTVTFWLVAWVGLAGLCAWAAISGRDRPTRVALVAVATVSAMEVLVIVADRQPISRESWMLGESVLNIGVVFALLASPLRSPPEVDDTGPPR